MSLVTPTHPIDPGARLDEWEGSAPVTICDNVWMEPARPCCPGTIGDGAGRSRIGGCRRCAAGQIAVGNPARVIRSVATRRRPAVFTCLVTCPVESADDLATALVEAGNAACVNLVDPVRSVYRWRGKIEHGREALLVVKTTRPRLFALESQLREIHPSEVHELVCLPVEAGSNPYLDWVADSVSQPDYPS
ncbi:MAG: divalent cation tolerance protein CutA [Solirubrobacterales bacterium]|nr:divalent cation tolerance protein CutA [Solirubrobacterales bacterium]